MIFQTNRFKKEKLSALMERMAAEFIAREANPVSLETVTGTEHSTSANHINILVTVLPESEEKNVINLLTKNKNGFFEYLDKHAKIFRIPSFDFKIDKGEKNRRKIEDII